MLLEGEIDGVVKAAFNVTTALFTLFVVSGVVAESVTITLATTIFPASALGNDHAKLAIVRLPDGS